VEHAEVVCLLDACFLVEDQLGVEHVVETELVEQEPYRAGVFCGRDRRQGAIFVLSQRIGETGEREVEPQPPPDVSLPEIASALVEAAVKSVQPRLPDLPVERVVGLLFVDGDVVLDGLERNPEILGSVAEGQEIAEFYVDFCIQVLAAAGCGVVAEWHELPEEGRVGLEGSVGVDRHYKDLTRRIAEYTVKVECEDMHEGEV